MLRLGSLTFTLPAVQAALSGYSDLAMRRVARAHGAQFAFHEVVLDEAVTRKGKLRRRILDVADDDHPVGGQLMGADPDGFGPAAADLVAAGYDVVDVNFGCPVPKVLGRCRGGFLLGTPDVALAILDAVVDAVDGRVPVMVKMRRGIDADAASERAFFTILDGAYERGVAAVVVHGRSVLQRYEGASDWEFLARSKRHVGDRVLLGSGDVFSAFAVRRMMATTGVDGVTVARGAIGNPWIFGQTADLLAGRTPMAPGIAEQRAAIELHREFSLRQYDDVDAARRTRRAAIRYARHHPQPLVVRDAFVGARDLAAIASVLDEFYGARFAGHGPRPLVEEDDAGVAALASSCEGA
jgi:tRNA-dihydrouridine synthase B